ncbi:helix-turn-helix domain-containing protein [Methylobacterium sp. sgz302541]|uniref:helix-turn-helix domain-containing protein n=1 Tax=unclassified Methylobacterium TaxID=2615210 RepID=UPI003D3549DA
MFAKKPCDNGICKRDGVNVSAKVTLDVDGILSRISDAVGAENDHQLAMATGTAQTTISTWRSKQRVPYDLCVKVSQEKNVHIAWILFGEEGIYPQSSDDEYGLIDINFYGFCWDAAEKVCQIDPTLEPKLTALMIYNSLWPKLSAEHSKSGKLTRSQAVLAYSVFEDLGMFDWEKYARELREKLDAYPSVGVAPTSRKPSRRSRK